MLAFGFEGHTTKFNFVTISLFRYHPIQKWHINTYRRKQHDFTSTFNTNRQGQVTCHFYQSYSGVRYQYRIKPSWFLDRIGLSVFGGSGAWPQRLNLSLKALHSQSGAPVVLAAFNMQVTTNDNRGHVMTMDGNLWQPMTTDDNRLCSNYLCYHRLSSPSLLSWLLQLPARSCSLVMVSAMELALAMELESVMLWLTLCQLLMP